jgi:hypothetical protein
MNIPENLGELLGSLPVTSAISHMLQVHPVTRQPIGQLRADSVVVELNKQEYMEMAMLGMYRMLRAEAQQIRAKNEAERTIRNDLQGILGEAVLMKGLGRSVGELIDIERDVSMREKRRGDIGNMEVRSTTGMMSPRTNIYVPSFYSRLIYRHGDDESKKYVLVMGVGTIYEIAGWLPGSECRRDAWANQGAEGRPKCWMVPMEELRPIRELLPVLDHKVEDAGILELIHRRPQVKVDVDDPVLREFEELRRRPVKDVRELWKEALMMHGAER